MVKDNKYKSCSRVLNEAHSSLFQWQQAQVCLNRHSVCLPRKGLMVWNPPPPAGWKSCNIDASYFENDGRSSYGCILQDDSVSFVASCGGRLQGALDSRVVEALALREALTWL